jgi:hypothetical protein
MPTFSKLLDLEMRGLQSMSRPQLTAEILKHGDCLPSDLHQRNEDEPIDRVRLLLFAARMIHALRQMPRHQRFSPLLDA